MIPRLGEQFNIEIEVVSKPRQEYQTSAYTELGLPKAPAIILDEEIIVAGSDIDEASLISKITHSMHKI